MNPSDPKEPLLTSKGNEIEQEEKITKASIFQITPSELQNLFNEDNLKQSEGKRTPSQSHHHLRELGYVGEIIQKLASDHQAGIEGDEKDLRRRERIFGKNLKPKP